MPPGGPPISPTPPVGEQSLAEFQLLHAPDVFYKRKIPEQKPSDIANENGADSRRPLDDGASFETAGKKLQHLTGLNGRRFQSAVPVHRSQFIDGFSGKLDIYVPPFFHIPPVVWET